MAIISLHQVSKRYPGGFEALKVVSFSVERGEMLFLTGHSGAGKTTLLKLIAAIEHANGGTVLVNGQNVSSMRSDEKSQHKNRAKGMKIMRARLLEKKQEEQRSEIAATRKSMVGSGDRSERIRTYNFPQGRLTDHRINLTIYQLDRIMEGQIDEVVEGLITHYQAEALKATA